MYKKNFIQVCALFLLAQAANADWFDDLKATGNAEDLYRALYYMPKGGDLHNHLSGDDTCIPESNESKKQADAGSHAKFQVARDRIDQPLADRQNTHRDENYARHEYRA